MFIKSENSNCNKDAGRLLDMLRFILAGGYYRSDAAKKFLASVRGPVQCFFERDPSNQHDPGAVKVICGEHHIGFVPKTILHEYGARMNITLPGTVIPMKEYYFKYQPIVECCLEGLSQDAGLCATAVRDDKVNQYCI